MSSEVTILDAHGRQVELPSVRRARRASQAAALGVLRGIGGYTGARSDKKSLKTWQPFAGSADSDALPDLPTLRARSRDLERNEPLATGAVGTTIDSVVGSGLQLSSALDRDYLGLDDETADAWEDLAERIWRHQAGGRRLDITGQQDDAGLCSNLLTSTLVSGDIFSIRRFVERPGELLGTRVQLCEADRVETPADLLHREVVPLGQRRDRRKLIRSGIELDANGMEMAYWVRDEHPGEALYGFGLPSGAPSSAYKRLMARNAQGDRLVLHHFDRARPNQSRGIPWLAPVIEPLKQLGRYTEAELAAAVISSYFTVYVTTNFGEGLSDEPDPEEWKKALEQDEIGFEPGGIFDLLPGQNITTANPSRPNAKFDPFFLSMTRQIGVALHLPQELVVKHFTASYSASQAAMIEAWRFFRRLRKWLVSTFLQETYGWVIEEAIARGILPAPGFFTDPLAREAWLGAEWTGDPKGHINPAVEVKALGEKEDRGWVTGAEATAESAGGSWERKQRRRARERRTLQQLDLLPNNGGSGPIQTELPRELADPDGAERDES